MLHSIADLTTLTKPATGDVPAKLVGASTTVVGDKMYLFGGRLVSERRMTNDLYAFDLESLNWERISYNTLDPSDAPRPRYFHSSDSWNNHLIIFGGMSNSTDANSPEDLCVLNDIRILDLSTNTWLPTSKTNPFAFPSRIEPSPESLLPRARYAHLSSVTADRLFIIGGQDIQNVWLDDACIYDLKAKQWIRRSEYPRHCGTYRSIAVSSDLCVRTSPDSKQSNSEPGARFRIDEGQPPKTNTTPPDSIIHLPYSSPPTLEVPCDIYLYSNYNFTDVKRELEVFTPLPASTEFSISDRSHLMPGPAFPPGLRFPTGAILGSHFIVAGTYLAHNSQSFSIWALDLVSMTWTRIDSGNALSTGSWFRSCVWASANKFYVFGSRNGNLVDDYSRRSLSWEDVAIIDLEAFGIYQPPKLLMPLEMQEAGLAALEEGVNADFDLVCDDGRKIKCSRKILEARWPWFKEERLKFLQAALQSMESLGNPAALDSPMPDVPGTVNEDARPDPRLTPRALNLSEPYAVTLAFLQYIYSTALLTPLQHAPAVLSQLLVLATTYKMSHLESLVKHAMHGALSNTTSVGVYEVATLCDCRSLQIRALKTVMSYSQKRPGRREREHTNGADRPPEGGGSSSHRTNGSAPPPDGHTASSRPRGTSDAYWRSGGYNVGPAPMRQYAQEPRSLNGLPELGIRDVFDSLDQGGYDDIMVDYDDVDPYYGREGSSSSHLAPLPARTHHQHIANPSLSYRNSVSTIAHKELCEVADLFLGTEEPIIEHSSPDDSSSPERYSDYRSRRNAHLLSPPASSFLSPDSRATSIYTDSSDNDQVSVASSDRSLFYAAPRRRQAQVSPILTRRPSDSDTPSLSSSTTSINSSRNGNRRSPITPLSAHSSPYMEHYASALPGLGSIEERQLAETLDTLTIRPVDSHEVKQSSDLSAYLAPTYLTPTTSLTPPVKPVAPSITSSNSSGTHSGGFSFFGKKSSKSDVSKEDAKAAKAEEKRRKKAEAKERTERLALELKRRQEKRTEGSSQHSGDSKDKAKKLDPASMYGSSFHMLGV